jgi:hypothetical protein
LGWPTQGKRLNVERMIKVVGGRGDTTLVPPSTIKIDLKAPVGPVGVPTTRSAAGQKGGMAAPSAGGSKTKSLRQGASASWWTARATAGEVRAGFSKEEILKPPKEDPNAPDGVFSRVRGLLQDLGVQ